MHYYPAILLVLHLALRLGAQDGSRPIIDMHWHGYSQAEYWKNLPAQNSLIPAPTSEELFERLQGIMDKYKIVTALLSGSPATIRAWKQKDNRFIGGYEYLFGKLVDTTEFKKLIEDGTIRAFAEMGSVYQGELLTQAKFETYLQICERYQIPVGYHTGNTAAGVGYVTPFRVKNADPLLIEDVIAKYPGLKIFIMHSGAEFYEHCIALMRQYPHLYSELGILLWGDELTQHQATEFLKQAKTAGILDRVMFGSDQMVWPDAVVRSIEFLNSLEFLSSDDKRNIFYNNAAKFLGLSKAEIEAHHQK